MAKRVNSEGNMTLQPPKLEDWMPLTDASYHLNRHFGGGWGEKTLRKRCNSGELRRGHEWIDVPGSGIVVNPNAVLTWLIEQNRES